jgi:hypothetical protein
VPVKNPNGHRISKSKFVAGVQCLKRLYLQKHQPELSTVSDAQQQRMDEGTFVGALARGLYPEGLLIEADRHSLGDALRATKRAIADRVSVIFEATFQHSGVLVRVDILERVRSGFRLTEVKAATRVKDYYAYDVGVQKYVIERCGPVVTDTRVMTLNATYQYNGRHHDLGRLFIANPVTPIGPREVSVCLNDQFAALSAKTPPMVKTDGQCTDPTECEFYDYCHPEMASDDVRNVLGWRAAERLVAEGITSVHDVPSAVVSTLSAAQRTKLNAVKSGEIWFDREAWRGSAGELRWPICFMDFETVNPALPRFVGMKPYQQIPFQWSVHRQETPGSALTHSEFLAESQSDPRPGFCQTLCRAVVGARTIIVYNATFESQILAALGVCLPAYAARLDGIRRKLWDLLPVVRSCVYVPSFGCSYSLKAVLPGLVPQMSYSDLEVADGVEAGVAWTMLLDPGLDRAEKGRIKRALLKYCGQDTLALHRVIVRLNRMAQKVA